MSKWSAQRRRPARRFLLQGQGRACFGRCAMEDFFLRSSEGVHWGDFVFASTAPPLAATACALRQRFLLPPIVATAKGARACGPRRAMARGRRTSYKRTNQTRYASATVAILAQGTSWAVAVTQAYLRCPKLRLAHLGPGMHLAYRASRDSHHCKQPPVWLAQSGSLLGIQMGSPITASGLQSGLLRCQPERMPGRSLARSLLPAQYTFCRVLDCTGHILHAGLRSVQRSCNRSDLQTPSRTI